MTLVLRQPPLWWDKQGFDQFHTAQCFDLAFHFVLEQRLELRRKITAGVDGERVDKQRLFLDVWREFLRRATSWPPPFFMMLVSVAEVALASACEPNERREDQRGFGPVVTSGTSSLSRSHHWVSHSRPVSPCLNDSFYPPHCVFNDAVCLICQRPLFSFPLPTSFLSLPLLLNIPTQRCIHGGFSWLG